ncbi:hypothetical protein [Leeia sp.]|uniref:hypothetical protein n=1 Tax=Leeia sp. TaxID=2884678 RepID=UPI0035B0AF62
MTSGVRLLLGLAAWLTWGVVWAGPFSLPTTLPPAARQFPVWQNSGAVTCLPADTNAGGQTSCSHFATHRFTANQGDQGFYLVSLRAPSSHCAPIMYVVFLDVLDGGTTPYFFGALHPGASASRLIRAAAGPHVLTIGAYGDTGLGGCNTSGIQSWSVDVRVEAENTPG